MALSFPSVALGRRRTLTQGISEILRICSVRTWTEMTAGSLHVTSPSFGGHHIPWYDSENDLKPLEIKNHLTALHCNNEGRHYGQDM